MKIKFCITCYYTHMGIYSFPLFTICFDINGDVIPFDKVILNFTDDQTIDRLDNHGIIINGKTTFEESIMASDDSSKIFGYFDHHECSAWTTYFDILFDQNPNIEEAQAHFYCSDERFPFVFIKSKTENLHVRYGSVHNILYTKLIIEDDDYDFQIDIDKYKDLVINHKSVFRNEFNNMNIKFDK